jgi:hypothetical protein
MGSSTSRALAPVPPVDPYPGLKPIPDPSPSHRIDTSKFTVGPADLSDRQLLGLPIDEATVAEASAATVRRVATGTNDATFVLTDSEAELYANQRRANDAVFELLFAGEWKRLGVGYAYLTLDVRMPKLVVRLVPQASPKALAVLESTVDRFLKERAATEVGAAFVGAEELNLMEDTILQSDVREQIQKVLRVPVATIDVDHIDQKVTVRLVRSPEAERVSMDLAAQEAVVRAVRAVAPGVVPVLLGTGERPILADNLSNPGPQEAGERIAQTLACTLGYSTTETIGGVATARMSTAGHCSTGTTVATSHLNFQIGPVAEHVDTNAGRDYDLISTRGDPATILLANGFTQDRAFALASATTLNRVAGVEEAVRQTGAWPSTTPNAGVTLCLFGATPRRDPGAVFTSRQPAGAPNPTRNRSCGTAGGNTSDGFGTVTGLGNYACTGDSGGLIAANNGATVYGGLHAAGLSGNTLFDSAAGGFVCSSTATFGFSQRTVTSGAATGRTILVSPGPTSPATLGTLRNAYTAPDGIQECVSASGSGTANGTTYVQWGCIPNQVGQAFGFQPAGAGYESNVYRLIRPNGVAPICLSVDRNYNGGYGNWVPIIGWGCIPALDAAQLWAVEWNPPGSSTGGWFLLRSLWSNAQCIAVNGSSGFVQGSSLHLWDCGDHPAEKWILGPRS